MELIIILLSMVIQHGGDDVSCKRSIEAFLIFPRNLPPKSYNDILFFLHPTRKSTNLKVGYFIQVTEGLIFSNLEIDIFCVAKEASRMF